MPEAKGATISGTVVIVMKRETDYGVHPAVIIDTGDDDYAAVHVFHEVLKEGLDEIRRSVGKLGGTRLMFAYAGKIASKKRLDSNGNPVEYHSYTVVPADGMELEEYDFDDAPHELLKDGDEPPY